MTLLSTILNKINKMQQFFSLIFFLFALFAGINSAPAFSDEVIVIDGKVLSTKIDINTFMPLYGNYQIKKLITSKTWGYLMVSKIFIY